MTKFLPIEEIILLYNQGLAPDKLGAKFGVNGETIRNRLKKANIPLRSLKDSMNLASVRAELSYKTIGRLAWNKGLSASSDARVAKYTNK